MRHRSSSILRKQHGFHDEIVFVAPGSGTELVAISLWDTKEDAEAYHRGSYPEVVKVLAKVVEGTPEVRSFEVASSTLHKDRYPRSSLRQARRLSRLAGGGRSPPPYERG